MGAFLVEGPRRLKGAVRVSGAKNSALKLMAAALLGQGVFHLDNVPRITDVRIMAEVLQCLGAKVTFQGHQMAIEVSSLQGRTPEQLVKSMRASVQVMGPLLARLGWVEVALPGGCAIGRRPLDIHLSGFQQMGASVVLNGDRLVARAPGGLRGADITLRYPSVGATENIMMAAALARGETVIRNAAREPEIVEVQAFLQAMGARVFGAGTPVITVQGVPELGCTDFSVMPDRIEAGTYLLAFLITGGEGTVCRVRPGHFSSLLSVIQAMGGEVAVEGSKVSVAAPKRLHPFALVTRPYPGFPTDLQPQMVAAATQAHGRSELRETVFDQRFGYVRELRKLGAVVRQTGQTVRVYGPVQLRGAQLEAGDLRAGAALVLAALAAEGRTLISGAQHIDRGYECLEEKLGGLGARITRLATMGG
ncbi:MAG TPA: UDP-N-acetylglucosamine 1-carboxyvinyltransferase [Limnochordia bacterium]|nr:UDP-N-acetylglucosamine 1-carboxyvinyltransferase [Limnochordia bacterium]